MIGNNVFDGSDLVSSNFPFNQNLNPSVAGRWGEAESVPGITIPFAQPRPLPAFVAKASTFVNLYTFTNYIRAGQSAPIAVAISGNPAPYDSNFNIIYYEVGDDDYDSYDPYPELNSRLGETGDLDLYDSTGSLILPVERMRRFGYPIDMAGDGLMVKWGNANSTALGPDQWGRISFLRYYRPAGLPGHLTQTNLYSTINTIPAGSNAQDLSLIGSPAGPPVRGITRSTASTLLRDPDYTQLTQKLDSRFYGGLLFNVPSVPYVPPYQPAPAVAVPFTPPTATPTYGSSLSAGSYVSADTGVVLGGASTYVDPTTNNSYSATYTSAAMNHANELNLYQPNQTDAPFGPSDLEWLYRQQDSDGDTLHSRLSQLAPISFNNPSDGQRRRRLFALDSWDLNRFVWANDSPMTIRNADPTFNGGQRHREQPVRHGRQPASPRPPVT